MNFERSIVIRSTPERLFRLTQDYGRRLAWDPFLKRADLLAGATEAAVGVRANCVARSGLAMETEYVSFTPPRVAAVKMTRGPWFLAGFAGSWRFKEEGAEATRVFFRYNVKGRPGWLAPLLTPVLGLVFARDTARRLAALKDAVERRGLDMGDDLPG